MIYCPVCDHEVEWDFNKCHHLAKFHCPNCSFTNHKADYLVESYDRENKDLITMRKSVVSDIRMSYAQNLLENFYAKSSYFKKNNGGFCY